MEVETKNEVEYIDFTTMEGAEMVKEMLSFLPPVDAVRTMFLEQFAMILLTV